MQHVNRASDGASHDRLGCLGDSLLDVRRQRANDLTDHREQVVATTVTSFR